MCNRRLEGCNFEAVKDVKHEEDRSRLFLKHDREDWSEKFDKIMLHLIDQLRNMLLLYGGGTHGT